MKRSRVLVVTADRYLGQKLRLELSDEAEVTVVSDAPRDTGDYRAVFFDADTVPGACPDAVILSRRADFPCDLPVPSPLGAASAFLGEPSESGKLLFFSDRRAVRFRGKTVRLTEAEYALLSLLADAGGAFVSRETCLRGAFSEDASDSALNVYIHYLREKLEFRGEKIILSSRKLGYAVDRKYIGTGGNDRA